MKEDMADLKNLKSKVTEMEVMIKQMWVKLMEGEGESYGQHLEEKKRQQRWERHLSLMVVWITPEALLPKSQLRKRAELVTSFSTRGY